MPEELINVMIVIINIILEIIINEIPESSKNIDSTL